MSISWLIALFNVLSDLKWTRFLSFIKHVRLWRGFNQHAYKVLQNHITLEICDAKGTEALFRKEKRVEFLQRDIFAFLDMAWGDGAAFVDYHCTPGKPVDFYEVGYRQHVIIALHEMKQVGDKETFHIQRKILNGYCDPDGYLQTDITHPTEYLEVSVIFPAQRQPQHIFMLEQNTKKTTQITDTMLRKLPDERLQVTWSLSHPRLYESYILKWY